MLASEQGIQYNEKNTKRERILPKQCPGSLGAGALDTVKKQGHREPARRLVHPRVASLALWAIHLLAISRFLRETLVF